MMLTSKRLRDKYGNFVCLRHKFAQKMCSVGALIFSRKNIVIQSEQDSNANAGKAVLDYAYHA